jgi:hypothetical protein
MSISGIIYNENIIGGQIKKTTNINGNIGSTGDKNFVFSQAIASDTWTIQHNLNKYCSVMVVDSAKTVVIGEITYIDTNNLTIHFNGAFTGKAYCN